MRHKLSALARRDNEVASVGHPTQRGPSNAVFLTYYARPASLDSDPPGAGGGPRSQRFDSGGVQGLDPAVDCGAGTDVPAGSRVTGPHHPQLKPFKPSIRTRQAGSIASLVTGKVLFPGDGVMRQLCAGALRSGAG
jgi:hypothetical protein